MGPDIPLSPTDTSTSRQSQALPLSPQSRSRSTEAVENLYSPWLDPLSPHLRDFPVFDSQHDSQIGLIGPNRNFNHIDDTGTGLNTFRSNTNRLPESKAWWKQALNSKWSMLFCIMLGVVGALGHHFLNYHLHGREAKDQRWWLRLGQFISFVAKANFVVAAMMAHQQVAWRAVGQKGFSVEAIDSLFGSAHNAIELFNREAWVKSWMVMFLAMYMWASPFVVIFTSATLDVIPGTIERASVCPSVRTLNFLNEYKESWRTKKRAENNTLNGLSISSYNETYVGGNLAPEKNESYLDIFEYWDQPSPALGTIFSGVVSSGRAIQRPNAAKEICGEGWDCSTTIHFLAPGYNCTELARGVNDTMKSFGKAEAPFQLSDLVPLGNFTYKAVTIEGEYARPQIEVKSDPKGGIPITGPPFPPNLGAFRTEPIIWIGYAAVDDITKKHALNESQKGWLEDYTPVIFACEHYETSYTVNINYTAGFQTYNVTKRDYKRKVIATTYMNNGSIDGTEDKTIATPERNYIFPRSDFATYRKVAAYHALGNKLRSLLSSSITLPGPTAFGDMTTSKLIDRHESLPIPNLRDGVQRLYEDVLISLLSDPQLLVVSWAANSSKLSGTGAGGDDTRYDCIRKRTGTFFFYQWQVLATVYIVSFMIASVGVAYGIFAMHRDGITRQRDITFSSIAVTTRRVRLDECGDRETKMRCWPVEEYPGARLYEFRAERHGG